jgi:glycosyltransferase involved in cell wall biosynthesis
MGKFSIMFAVDAASDDDCSAVQRFRILKQGLEKLGAETGIIYLGDLPIGRPRILLAANTPFYLKTVKDYDFVHAAGLAVMAMGLSKPFGNYKIIYDVHGSMQEFGLTKTNKWELQGNYQMLAAKFAWDIGKRRADYFVTVSPPLQEELLRNGVKKEKTELLYNGVDTDLFKPAEKQANEKFTVTYAGAYQKWQGVENLVQAAELVHDPKIRFRLMGFQKRDAAVKALVSTKLQDRAELFDFQPRINNQQPHSFVDDMAQSDVLIIPRYYDPANPLYSNADYVRNTFGWLPTKFAEYIATGRPVIVTNMDIAADFVEKYDCGFVCDADPASVAKAIIQAKETAPEELDRMGRNGRRLAEDQFSMKAIAKKYFDILSTMANS